MGDPKVQRSKTRGAHSTRRETRGETRTKLSPAECRAPWPRPGTPSSQRRGRRTRRTRTPAPRTRTRPPPAKGFSNHSAPQEKCTKFQRGRTWRGWYGSCHPCRLIATPKKPQNRRGRNTRKNKEASFSPSCSSPRSMREKDPGTSQDQALRHRLAMDSILPRWSRPHLWAGARWARGEWGAFARETEGWRALNAALLLLADLRQGGGSGKRNRARWFGLARWPWLLRFGRSREPPSPESGLRSAVTEMTVAVAGSRAAWLPVWGPVTAGLFNLLSSMVLG